MNNVMLFINDFYGQFFKGVESIYKGLAVCFNFKKYLNIYICHKSELKGSYKILGILCMIILFCFLVGLVVLIIFSVVNRFSHTHVASTSEVINALTYPPTNPVPSKRFNQLYTIDERMLKNQPIISDDLTLEEIVHQFRGYAANNLHLYYDLKVIRTFLSAMASSHLIILQGISGTGKTSLPFSFSKFMKNDALMLAVQPSWKDQTDLFGYYNEFSSSYHETEFLNRIYQANYDEHVHFTILDEMNLSRVEYYFAQMLSILEIPESTLRNIPIISTFNSTDPKGIKEGSIHIPDNMYYIGTANNDDSTYTITDKVYDRAITIDLDHKASPVSLTSYDQINISYEKLNQLFNEAIQSYPITSEVLSSIKHLDQYMIQHFKISFGNRILKQIENFIPVYVTSGGDELEALDFLIKSKILRKLQNNHTLYSSSEYTDLISYLDERFGKGVMKESIDMLKQL